MLSNLGSTLNVDRLIARRRHPCSIRDICSRLGSIIVVERLSPLTCSTNPHLLLMDWHDGDPEQLEPCRALGRKNGSIVATRTFARILSSFRFNPRSTSENNGKAKEHYGINDR